MAEMILSQVSGLPVGSLDDHRLTRGCDGTEARLIAGDSEQPHGMPDRVHLQGCQHISSDPRRHYYEWGLAQDQLLQCADQLAEAGDCIAAYQDGGLFQHGPRGAGIGNEIARGVTGFDSDGVGIGQLFGDGLPFGVAEIGRRCVFGSAPSLQIRQVVRGRSVWMKLRNGPGRRREHLGGSLLVSPAVPHRTEDDRAESRNDQHDQADAPRIHLFRVPQAAMREQFWKIVVMRYESWVERQIREAIERGEFDNLPGQGRPIKGLNGREDENWWVKAYLEREQLPLPLPTSLALRREVMALPETLADVADEESVREIVRDLNRRIAESHRIRVDGPAIVIGLVNVDRAVANTN